MTDDDLDPEDLPAPRTGEELRPRNLERVHALVGELGFMLPDDLLAIGAMGPTALKDWAKRGEGPPYVLFGKRRLYPIDGVREFLRGRVKARANHASRLL